MEYVVEFADTTSVSLKARSLKIAREQAQLIANDRKTSVTSVTRKQGATK